MFAATNRPLLWTIDEAARRLRVSSRTVRRMLNPGDLPKVRVRGAVRIPVQAVREWMTRQLKCA